MQIYYAFANQGVFSKIFTIQLHIKVNVIFKKNIYIYLNEIR